jgi:hypothetical protein
MMPHLIHISQSPASFQRRRLAARMWAKTIARITGTATRVVLPDKVAGDHASRAFFFS